MNLYGIHDYDPAWASIIFGAGMGGWAVTTHALGTDRNDRSGYDYSLMLATNTIPIARLNNGYNPAGSIPLPSEYDAFANRCANFVSASHGCIRWIIGNEPNLVMERPNGVPITPAQYARCFAMCRNAIKQRGLQHQVGVAAIGPWNAQSGPFIQYLIDVLANVEAQGGADFLTFHAYTRTDNPADIASEEKMKADGYTQFYNNFRTYQDFMHAIPASMRNLPVHGTEADEIEGWTNENTGVVKAMYYEINDWNSKPGNQPIQSLCLYRWPKGEEYGIWGIEGKAGVIQDFANAVSFGYVSPKAGTVVQEEVLVDVPVTPQPSFKPVIDPRLGERGVTITYAAVAQGQGYWRVKNMRWYNEQEADSVGPDHHIVGTVTKGGQRVVDLPLRVTWPDATDIIKSKANPADAFNYDFAMTKSLHEFSIHVDDGNPSDEVKGIGMGADGNSGIHTDTWIDWEWALATSEPVVQPVPVIPVGDKVPVPALVHPVAIPAMRVISEGWGGDEEYYKRYKVDNVALKGHNGIDFAVPVSTPVRVVANGTVREAWFEATGYGNLLLVDHVWGQSLYAHLDRRVVEAGQSVTAGQNIAFSGATGMVTGPHLHFAMRVFPYARGDGWGGYSDPTPYLANEIGAAPLPPTGPTKILIDPMTAAAIINVESNGAAFGPDGRMTIRFEAHIFEDDVPLDVFAQHFQVGEPMWDGDQHKFLDPDDGQWKAFHGDQNLEYKALAQAFLIDPEAAYQATSMGMAQVMGFNAQRIGFKDAREMFKLLRSSDSAQFMAFVNYVLTDADLRKAMADRNFEKVAELYNGSGSIAVYAARMRHAYSLLVG